MTRILEHVMMPLYPLVDDPLVPMDHGTTQVLHPLVHQAPGVDGVPVQGGPLIRGHAQSQVVEHGTAPLHHVGEVHHEGHQSLTPRDPVPGIIIGEIILQLGVAVNVKINEAPNTIIHQLVILGSNWFSIEIKVKGMADPSIDVPSQLVISMTDVLNLAHSLISVGRVHGLLCATHT